MANFKYIGCYAFKPTIASISDSCSFFGNTHDLNTNGKYKHKLHKESLQDLTLVEVIGNFNISLFSYERFNLSFKETQVPYLPVELSLAGTEVIVDQKKYYERTLSSEQHRTYEGEMEKKERRCCFFIHRIIGSSSIMINYSDIGSSASEKTKLPVRLKSIIKYFPYS